MVSSVDGGFRNFLRKAVGGMVLVAALGLLPGNALAATYTVTKTGDTNDGSCDADCSLREAIVAANGNPGPDTVTFSASLATYTLSIPPVGGNGTTSGDLNIQDDLVVVGNGESGTVIHGGNIDRVFHVLPGVTVSITGLTVREGKMTDSRNGAGICNQGDLTLSDVTVEMNQACNGGGISNSGTASLDNVTVRENDALSGTGGCSSTNTGFGGGVYNLTGGVMTITNSLVRGNTATKNGGGIYNSNGIPGASQITMTGGEVRENVAGAYGGGIDNEDTLTISGTTFRTNTAAVGGGISNRDAAAVLSVSGTAFTDNSATGSGTGGGGAMFSYRADATVSNSSFTGNWAKGEGGGAIESTGTLTVSGSSFFGNHAPYHYPNTLPGTTGPGMGGAALLISGGEASFINCSMTGNTAGVSGGAIYNDRNAILTLSGTTIDANTILDNDPGNGAEDCTIPYDPTREGCRGGGILNEGNLTVTNSTIINNSAPLQGGGISHAVGTLNVVGSTLSGNQSDHGGGIYNMGTATVERATISGNSALLQFGGGIQNDRTLTVTNSTISGNDAGVGGGISSSTLGNVTLTNVTITDNTASTSASAVYNWKGMVTTANTIFDGTCNNWHVNSGGSGDENPSSPASGGGNLESPGNTCALPAGTDKRNVSDPRLDNLADNGGPTLTHMPLSSSPVIDAGVSGQCRPTDQRGAPRPFDGDTSGTAQCDIGAVEYGSAPPADAILTLVIRYYNDILGRAPEKGGAEWWQAQIERLVFLGVDIKEGFVAIAKQFFNSAEYIGKGKTSAQFVADLYQTFFERMPSQAETDFWVGRILGGVSRNTVMNFFMFSAEFANYIEGIFGPSATRPENNMVNDFYRGLLSRLPDDAGYAYWLGRFRTAQCAGDGAQIQFLSYQIASLFVSLPEYLNKGRDSAGYIEDVYDAIMRRDGDPGGISYWVNALNGSTKIRDDVMVSFTNSVEFQGRVDEVIAAGCAP